jgi:nicotinamide-nucleotide amidase
VLPNRWGTAPGLWLEDERGRLAVLLPGVPGEMRGLLEQEVIPRLVERRNRLDRQAPGGPPVIVSRQLRTTGISESALADRVGDVTRFLGEHVTLAWLPGFDGTDLRLTAWGLPADAAGAALAKAAAALRPLAGHHYYGEDEADLAAVVLTELERRKAHLAVAESCTGGLLGGRVTAVPGSSRVFLGGVVAYDNEVKLGMLGVSADILAQHGAVSEEVVRQMASGVARTLGADVALAVTGVAGPDGGTVEKPVGTVWIGVLFAGQVRAFRYTFPGDRDNVRRRAAQAALDALRRVLAGGGER